MITVLEVVMGAGRVNLQILNWFVSCALWPLCGKPSHGRVRSWLLSGPYPSQWSVVIQTATTFQGQFTGKEEDDNEILSQG